MTINIVNRLSATGQDIVTAVTPSVAPALQPGLFVPSESRSYNAADYDFSADGLYTLFSIYSPSSFNSGNCISYAGNVVELMRSLAYLTQYGTADEALTAAQAQNQMRMRKVAMRCEPIDTIVVKPICAAKNIPYRTVRWLTAETPNDFDDGHVACEVQIGGVWKFFDIPNKNYVESSGVISSAAEIAATGLENLTIVEMCVGDCYPSTWSASIFPTAIYYAQNMMTAAMRDAWRQRIYQIPGIVHTDGLTYFYLPEGTESRETWVLGQSASYRVISESSWLSMFYP